MQVSEYIRTGFAKVREFEREANPSKRRTHQFDHLMAIADHEQRIVLQPLIYDDSDFAFWIRTQRSAWVNWMAPDLELVFTSACEIDDQILKSVAPDDTKLEDEQSRMFWIDKAAKHFHKLMAERKTQMESELTTMAGWVARPDQ